MPFKPNQEALALESRINSYFVLIHVCQEQRFPLRYHPIAKGLLSSDPADMESNALITFYNHFIDFLNVAYALKNTDNTAPNFSELVTSFKIQIQNTIFYIGDIRFNEALKEKNPDFLKELLARDVVSKIMFFFQQTYMVHGEAFCNLYKSLWFKDFFQTRRSSYEKQLLVYLVSYELQETEEKPEAMDYGFSKEDAHPQNNIFFFIHSGFQSKDLKQITFDVITEWILEKKDVFAEVQPFIGDVLQFLFAYYLFRQMPLHSPEIGYWYKQAATLAKENILPKCFAEPANPNVPLEFILRKNLIDYLASLSNTYLFINDSYPRIKFLFSYQSIAFYKFLSLDLGLLNNEQILAFSAKHLKPFVLEHEDSQLTLDTRKAYITCAAKIIGNISLQEEKTYINSLDVYDIIAAKLLTLNASSAFSQFIEGPLEKRKDFLSNDPAVLESLHDSLVLITKFIAVFTLDDIKEHESGMQLEKKYLEYLQPIFDYLGLFNESSRAKNFLQDTHNLGLLKNFPQLAAALRVKLFNRIKFFQFSAYLLSILGKNKEHFLFQDFIERIAIITASSDEAVKALRTVLSTFEKKPLSFTALLDPASSKMPAVFEENDLLLGTIQAQILCAMRSLGDVRTQDFLLTLCLPDTELRLATFYYKMNDKDKDKVFNQTQNALLFYLFNLINGIIHLPHLPRTSAGSRALHLSSKLQKSYLALAKVPSVLPKLIDPLETKEAPSFILNDNPEASINPKDLSAWLLRKTVLAFEHILENYPGILKALGGEGKSLKEAKNRQIMYNFLCIVLMHKYYKQCPLSFIQLLKALLPFVPLKEAAIFQYLMQVFAEDEGEKIQVQSPKANDAFTEAEALLHKYAANPGSFKCLKPLENKALEFPENLPKILKTYLQLRFTLPFFMSQKFDKSFKAKEPVSSLKKFIKNHYFHPGLELDTEKLCQALDEASCTSFLWTAMLNLFMELKIFSSNYCSKDLVLNLNEEAPLFEKEMFDLLLQCSELFIQKNCELISSDTKRIFFKNVLIILEGKSPYLNKKSNKIFLISAVKILLGPSSSIDPSLMKFLCNRIKVLIPALLETRLCHEAYDLLFFALQVLPGSYDGFIKNDPNFTKTDSTYETFLNPFLAQVPEYQSLLLVLEFIKDLDAYCQLGNYQNLLALDLDIFSDKLKQSIDHKNSTTFLNFINNDIKELRQIILTVIFEKNKEILPGIVSHVTSKSIPIAVFYAYQNTFLQMVQVLNNEMLAPKAAEAAQKEFDAYQGEVAYVQELKSQKNNRKPKLNTEAAPVALPAKKALGEEEKKPEWREESAEDSLQAASQKLEEPLNPSPAQELPVLECKMAPAARAVQNAPKSKAKPPKITKKTKLKNAMRAQALSELRESHLKDEPPAEKTALESIQPQEPPKLEAISVPTKEAIQPEALLESSSEQTKPEALSEINSEQTKTAALTELSNGPLKAPLEASIQEASIEHEAHEDGASHLSQVKEALPSLPQDLQGPQASQKPKATAPLEFKEEREALPNQWIAVTRGKSFLPQAVSQFILSITDWYKGLPRKPDAEALCRITWVGTGPFHAYQKKSLETDFDFRIFDINLVALKIHLTQKGIRCTLTEGDHPVLRVVLYQEDRPYEIDIGTIEKGQHPSHFAALSDYLKKRDFNVASLCAPLWSENGDFTSLDSLKILGQEEAFASIDKKLLTVANWANGPSRNIFKEDPTRLFRYIKYLRRYKFRPDTYLKNLLSLPLVVEYFQDFMNHNAFTVEGYKALKKHRGQIGSALEKSFKNFGLENTLEDLLSNGLLHGMTNFNDPDIEPMDFEPETSFFVQNLDLLYAHYGQGSEDPYHQKKGLYLFLYVHFCLHYREIILNDPQFLTNSPCYKIMLGLKEEDYVFLNFIEHQILGFNHSGYISDPKFSQMMAGIGQRYNEAHGFSQDLVAQSLPSLPPQGMEYGHCPPSYYSGPAAYYYPMPSSTCPLYNQSFGSFEQGLNMTHYQARQDNPKPISLPASQAKRPEPRKLPSTRPHSSKAHSAPGFFQKGKQALPHIIHTGVKKTPSHPENKKHFFQNTAPTHSVVIWKTKRVKKKKALNAEPAPLRDMNCS